MSSPQPIAVDCHGCGQVYHVLPPAEDLRAKCRRCGHEFVISAAASAPREKRGRPSRERHASEPRLAGAHMAARTSQFRRPRNWKWSSRRLVTPAIGILVAGFVAAAIVGAVASREKETHAVDNLRRGRVAKLSAPRTNDEFRTVSELIEAVEPAVVQIETNGGVSSGFVIDPSGLIVTCHHCIEGEESASVVLPDQTRLRVIGVRGVDPDRDLAILEVEPEKPLATLALASTPAKKGEPIVAFGSPLGLSFTVSEGSVSALRTGKEIVKLSRQFDGLFRSDYRFKLAPEVQLVQFTASTMPGNSGGPVVDFRGNVIGISSFGLNWRGQTYEFGISWTEIKSLAKNLDEGATSLFELASMPDEASAATAGGDDILGREQEPGLP